MSRIFIAALFVAGASYASVATATDKHEQRAAACANQPTLAEQAVCNDKQLTRLDGQLNEAYEVLRKIASTSQFNDIRADQRAWLKERNACGDDTACLKDQYTDRIAVLEQTQENIAYSDKSHNEIGTAELSCAVQPKLNSPTSSKEKVTVTFKNKSEGYRGVMWLGFDGRPVEYKNLDRGQSYTVDTYVGHIWMFTDGPGNCMELYTAKSGVHSFNVTAASPAFGAGND